MYKNVGTLLKHIYIQTFFTKDEDIRNYFYQNELNSKYILPVNMMVKEFEKISCISIEDYDVLSKNILNHLITFYI